MRYSVSNDFRGLEGQVSYTLEVWEPEESIVMNRETGKLQLWKPEKGLVLSNFEIEYTSDDELEFMFEDEPRSLRLCSITEEFKDEDTLSVFLKMVEKYDIRNRKARENLLAKWQTGHIEVRNGEAFMKWLIEDPDHEWRDNWKD